MVTEAEMSPGHTIEIEVQFRCVTVSPCAGNAAHPREDPPANFRQDFSAGNDVGDSKASTRLEHAERLAQDFIFVGRKIDHAVRDDHVDRPIGERNVLDFTFQKLDIGNSGLALILTCQREHLVSHIEAVRFAGRCDAARRDCEEKYCK